MTYPALGKFDASADQALGLTIQRLDDSDTAAADDEAYLLLILQGILDSYAERHVVNVKQARLADAVKTADQTKLEAIASAAGVDLTIPIPAVKP